MADPETHATARIPAAHRLLLTVQGSGQDAMLKEIVTTIDVSRTGARLRGRRTLKPDWQGTLVLLDKGRQASFRVLWQTKLSGEEGVMETGVEISGVTDFWGIPFPEPEPPPPPADIAIEEEPVEPEKEPAAPEKAAVPAEEASVPRKDAPMTPEDVLTQLQKSSAVPSEGAARLLEAVWCGLVEQLEERHVLTRPELLAIIRKIGQI